MSADNTLEQAVASMVLNGTDPAFRAAAMGYVALFTDDRSQMAAEDEAFQIAIALIVSGALEFDA